MSVTVGAFPPPPGVTPDFQHPRDAGRSIHLIGIIVCVSLVTIFFLIRCYVKLRIIRGAVLEDWTCCGAWVFLLMFATGGLCMIRHGEGYHAWEITRSEYDQYRKWLYVSSLVYIPSAYLTKTTLLLLIARVFAAKKHVARAIHIFIVVLFFGYLPIQITKIIICTPIHAFWDSTITNERCLDQRKLFVSDTSMAMVTDLAILLVPIPLTWSLNMPTLKKVKIACLLGAGGIATGVTVFRLFKVVQFLDSKDPTADFVLLNLTTIIEVTTGLICACIPSTNLLLERCWARRSSLNRPKSDDSSMMSKLKLLQKKYLSTRGSTARQPRSEMTAFKFPAQHRTAKPTRLSGTAAECHTTDFDAELALFTGQEIESGTRDDGGHNEWMLTRVSSQDGRRDGWLSPAAQENSDLGLCARSPGTLGKDEWSVFWNAKIKSPP